MQETVIASNVQSTVAAPASAVVSNDAATVAKTAQGTKVTFAAIEQLVAEREVWQANAFRTSNEQLYALLQKCYGLYKAMEGTSAEAVALRNGLRDYINVKGYIFAKSTHSLSKIVKCVFGIDRRRVSTYSIVLRAALAKGVSVLDVTDFIRNAGGVEEIRLAKAPNALSPKQKAAVTTNTVAANDIGVVNSPALAGMLDAGKIGTNTVLIGTWQSDGSIVVRTVVESDTVLTAALASHYNTIKEAVSTQGIEQKAAATADTKQQAIDAAAATATLTA